MGAAGTFVHVCALCGAVAHYGYGRSRTAPLYWTCAAHRADGERRLSLPEKGGAVPPKQGALL